MYKALPTSALDCNEGHKAFRETVRRFVEKEILPNVDAWDEAEEFPRELYRRGAELGLFGLGFPEEYGGVPGDLFYGMVMVEELTRAASGGLLASLFSHTIGAPPIAAGGSAELKARVLPQILSGEKISALAVTEPSGGSDVANIKLRAERDGDHYILNGSKTFITSGMRADYITVAARTGGPGAAGVSALLVEGDTPGLTRTSLKKMGWWCSDTAQLHFDHCRVPVANLLGQENCGFQIFMLNFNQERLALALQAYGFARVCLDEASEWASSRTTFGKRLVGHQAGGDGDPHRSDPRVAGGPDAPPRSRRVTGGANLHAEEFRRADHAILRRQRRADSRWNGFHARYEIGAHLPRGQGQHDRRRCRGSAERAGRAPIGLGLIDAAEKIKEMEYVSINF
jgi:acyl-CoA dehydrogenase